LITHWGANPRSSSDRGGPRLPTDRGQLLVNDYEVDFLLARGYPLKRTDNRSIAEAVSAYLSDSVLEGA
jgi:hypothetical protein